MLKGTLNKRLKPLIYIEKAQVAGRRVAPIRYNTAMNKQTPQTTHPETVSIATPTPPTPVATGQSPVKAKGGVVLGVLALVFALIALVAPIVHWLAFVIPTPVEYQGTASAISGAAFLAVAGFALEIFLLPTIGLTSLILGIVALIKGGKGRLFGGIALGVNILIIILIIAQLIFWATAEARING